MKRRTAQEIADELSIERPAADGLIKFLCALGVAQFVGERPNPHGRGKGQHVYEIQPGAGQAVADRLLHLEG